MRHHTRSTLAAAGMIAIAVAGSPLPPKHSNLAPLRRPPRLRPAPRPHQRHRCPNRCMRVRWVRPPERTNPMMGGLGHPNDAMPPCPAGLIASGAPPACK